MYWKIVLREKFGGQGSGNFGHAGRPGDVGGSAPQGGGAGEGGQDGGTSTGGGLGTDPVMAKREKINQVAKEIGFAHPEKIWTSEESKTFTLDNQQMLTAGEYDPSSGQITIYGNAFQDDQSLLGVVAHEVQHSKFDEVKQAYEAERQKIINDPNPVDKIHADGSLKTGYESQFPVYAIVEPHLEWTAQYEKDDGITPYSTAWWNDWKNGRPMSDGIYTPINETLAEVARLKAVSGAAKDATIPRSYLNLYKAVNKAQMQYGKP